MTYKNIFSLEPSELHIAEKIITELGKMHEVFFPIKDTAVDLIVSKNLTNGERKIITIQVKSSRMFEKGVEKELPTFWIKLNPKKLEKFREKVDFYIFVFYKVSYKPDKIPHFSKEYAIIPTEDLIGKSKNKKGWQRGWLNYYFLLYPDGSMFDVRDTNRKNLKTEKKKTWRIYTKYRNAFHLLK